jgi:hypothetical protein
MIGGGEDGLLLSSPILLAASLLFYTLLHCAYISLLHRSEMYLVMAVLFEGVCVVV